MVVKIVAGGHRHPLATPRIGGEYSWIYTAGHHLTAIFQGIQSTKKNKSGNSWFVMIQHMP